tara:strand:+ start:260 stop:847 length:588 start_codon:yes stop_codon:yes gene_type:complete
MATVNGDTVQDTTLDDVQVQQGFTVYGTGQFYSGLTVLIGGYHYTTVGGALEGNSLQLVPIPQAEVEQQIEQSGAENDNPVVELFQAPATPRYRRSDNNLLVPIGAPLHRHADDTIMTEHSMGPNDNSVVVLQVFDDEIGGQEADNTNNQQNQQGGGMNGGTNGGMNGNGGNSPDVEIPDPQAGQGGGGTGGGQY